MSTEGIKIIFAGKYAIFLAEFFFFFGGGGGYKHLNTSKSVK